MGHLTRPAPFGRSRASCVRRGAACRARLLAAPGCLPRPGPNTCASPVDRTIGTGHDSIEVDWPAPGRSKRRPYNRTGERPWRRPGTWSLATCTPIDRLPASTARRERQTCWLRSIVVPLRPLEFIQQQWQVCRSSAARSIARMALAVGSDDSAEGRPGELDTTGRTNAHPAKTAGAAAPYLAIQHAAA